MGKKAAPCRNLKPEVAFISKCVCERWPEPFRLLLVVVIVLVFSAVFEHEHEDDGVDDGRPGLFEHALIPCSSPWAI
jgi:hypothetical protein